MRKNNVTLTDFSLPKWKSIVMESVIDAVSRLGDKTGGQIGHPPDGPEYGVISISKCSHWIENIKIEGRKVTGDLVFPDTDLGRAGFERMDRQGGRMSVRAVGSQTWISEIITWDIV